MTKFSSFCLTLLLVILFLGFKAAIVVAVSTFVVLYILYKIKLEWFKPFDRYTPEDDFDDIDI